jgi:hypothetical protein
MAESILKMYDGNGSPLAVPVSPANGVTPDDVSIVGISQLHNQYSNIGDPNLTAPAYRNMGAAAMGYSNPKPSQAGQAANTYQGETNRYKNNAPENRSF